MLPGVIKSWPYPPSSNDGVLDYLKRLYSALVENSIQASYVLPSKIDNLAADPDTTKWGATDAGRIWYNTVSAQVKYWDGANIVVL